jgi:hypothetical protein
MMCLVSLAGCVKPKSYITMDRLQRGLAIVLPGIEGRRSGLADHIAAGLNTGGVNWAIEIYDWTSEWGLLYNQRAEKHNRREADKLALRIRRYQVAHPNRPIVLVGQSGGGALAVWAMEALGDRHKIKGAVLVNVALSPEYPLLGALNHSEEGIVNFYSPRDWMLLGVGTTVYGTMDGAHSVSAGMEGFSIAADAPKGYRRVYQVGWTKEMSKTGHSGLHMTSAASGFVAQYIAPILQAETWSQELIQAVQSRSVGRTLDSPTSSPEEPASAEAERKPSVKAGVRQGPK